MLTEHCGSPLPHDAHEYAVAAVEYLCPGIEDSSAPHEPTAEERQSAAPPPGNDFPENAYMVRVIHLSSPAGSVLKLCECRFCGAVVFHDRREEHYAWHVRLDANVAFNDDDEREA